MDLQQILPLAAPFMAAGAFFIGTIATLRPTWMSVNFGIPTQWPNSGLIVGLGIRDLFMGAVILHAWYNQDWSALSLWSACLAVVAVGDFAIVYKAGNTKASLTHLMGVFACAGYALLLFLFM
ncbi:MAG: DUF4267 domain-containing protein [Bdellovibrionales bacterium]|nr:DUF4267 domain-containing protein [Bdellovibrionales bacterium]